MLKIGVWVVLFLL